VLFVFVLLFACFGPRVGMCLCLRMLGRVEFRFLALAARRLGALGFQFAEVLQCVEDG
jgi:hypothetical protein